MLLLLLEFKLRLVLLHIQVRDYIYSLLVKSFVFEFHCELAGVLNGNYCYAEQVSIPGKTWKFRLKI